MPTVSIYLFGRYLVRYCSHGGWDTEREGWREVQRIWLFTLPAIPPPPAQVSGRRLLKRLRAQGQTIGSGADGLFSRFEETPRICLDKEAKWSEIVPSGI